MTRAVFDPNVLIAAALAPLGAPAACLRAHAEGRFELLANETLLTELARVLARDKFRRYLSLDQAERYVAALRRDALPCPDPIDLPALRSPDPHDDYLLALAGSQGAHALVTGDAHLLGLKPPSFRILNPRAFLALLPV